MKILHTEWSIGWGGQEIRTYSEIKYLKEKIDFVVAVRDNSILGEKVEKLGVKVYKLPFKGNLDITTLFSLVKIIKNEKIDIINTHSGKDTWVGGLAGKIAGIKFIRTRHLANRINPSRLNFINEIADFVITTGNKVKEDMLKFNRIKPNKIESIPTGVDEEIFDPSKYDRNVERNKLNINSDQIAIGVLGVLRRVKRHNDFIKAAKILNEKYDNLKFFIAGDGPLKEQLIDFAKQENISINFLGHIDNVANYLSALDIFVNSSESEGVPQAVIQALMMNKAVVATDVGSTKDLYNNNFLLALPKNPDNLAENIEKLIVDLNLRKELSLKARNSVINEFSIKAMKNKLMSVYERVLK